MRHLSSAFEILFKQFNPDAATAAWIRATLTHAIRTGDIGSALTGKDVRTIDETALQPWMQKLLREAFGDETPAVITSLMSDAATYIRVNTLKATPDTVLRALDSFGVRKASGWPATTLVVERPFGMFATQAFKDGWFEQQDAASQYISEFAAPAPGNRVIDACAGAGGKTLHMAALMQNKGKILCLDIAADKLQHLKYRTARAGVNIAEVRQITTTKVVKRLAETADVVLVDVPCTGTGVIRRNPDIIWHMSEQSYQELMVVQANILRRSAACAKPGGVVVYSTCSLLPQEGPWHVQEFLKSNPGYTLEQEWNNDTRKNLADGFYAARIRRI